MYDQLKSDLVKIFLFLFSVEEEKKVFEIIKSLRKSFFFRVSKNVSFVPFQFIVLFCVSQCYASKGYRKCLYFYSLIVTNLYSKANFSFIM